MIRSTVLLLLSSVILLCGVVLGQDITIRSSSTVVLVPTLVTDSGGKPVYGLHAEDFYLEDNGIEQKVTIDETLESQPISLVLAIEKSQDASAALEKIQRLGTLIDPVIGDGKGEVAVVTFDSESKLVQDFTPDTSKVDKILKGIKANGDGPAILDAMRFSAKLLAARPKNHRKVLLLISETRDHGSSSSVEDVIRQLEASNTLVYSSTFSPVVDSLWATPTSNTPNFLNLFKILVQEAKENVPKTLAEVSGGEFLPFKSERSFEDKMTEISNHVFNLYLLSYQPQNLQPGQHTLRVRLRFNSAANIYARQGYWAAQESQAQAPQTAADGVASR
ncbi:MAG TPA: VWA domain-containing protein [Terriglobales bacterium]|nr:VWA domain-containing protein [Terriglobales bacterium]